MFGCGAGSKVGVMKHDRGKAEGVRAKPLYRYYTPGVKRRQQSGCPSDFAFAPMHPLSCAWGSAAILIFFINYPNNFCIYLGFIPKARQCANHHIRQRWNALPRIQKFTPTYSCGQMHGKAKTKRPRSCDRGLLAKEGKGKELPILYTQPPQPTIRQRSLPIVGTVLARQYAEGMAVL